MTRPQPTQPTPLRFDLGTFPLACGDTLPAAWLDYRVFGTLNASRSNLILYPSSYGAWPDDLSWAVGPILDPTRYCIVLVSQFGNGRSTSPSNGGPPLGAAGWPLDHRDNLRAQIRLLEEVFAVEQPALVYGWSMGAQQAYHWGVLEAQRPRRLCCVCGTARTTPHNRLFLLSLRHALTSDPAWDGEGFTAVPEQGLRHFALIYASWAASQPYYRRGAHLELGYDSVEAYVQEAWLPAYRRHDPRDLIAMLDVWLACDVAAAAGLTAPTEEPNGPGTPSVGNAAAAPACPSDDQAERALAEALGRIRAATTVVAGRHDLYFPPADCAAEAAMVPGARLAVLESDLGHRAGNPRQAPAEQVLLRELVEELLRR